jgi:hypothetical protein
MTTKPTPAKGKTFNPSDALARASALAANKMAPQSAATPAPGAKPTLVQFNVKIPADKLRKLRAIALAWDTTPKDMLEAFIDQLPDVTPKNVDAPESVAWAKPRD